jgi:hypothetical protein
MAPVMGAVWMRVVELAPIHAAQKLLDDAVQHGAAPDQGLVAGIQEAHGHQLHAELIEGLDALAVGHGGAIDAHHQRDVGAVDVGIHQAGGVAQFGERHGQVHRHGGFSDAAFAGAYRDQIFHTRNGQLGRLPRLIRTHSLHGTAGVAGIRAAGRLQPRAVFPISRCIAELLLKTKDQIGFVW